MNDFWHMGGYAAYIWSAYGIVLSSLLGVWFCLLKQHQQLLVKISKQ